MDLAVAGGQQQLVVAVAEQVDEAGARGAHARDLDGRATDQVRVVVDEDLLLHLPAEPVALPTVGRHDDRTRTENRSSSGRFWSVGSTGAPVPSFGRLAAIDARSRLASVPDTGAVSPLWLDATVQWSVAG